MSRNYFSLYTKSSFELESDIFPKNDTDSMSSKRLKTSINRIHLLFSAKYQTGSLSRVAIA